ncbi:MAG: polysaccharide deacetylase family protein [Desulfuromonadaceae bacterium]|nr:polysaccharide deacetylase family protein [Desulfuromonadaceae bacterium]
MDDIRAGIKHLLARLVYYSGLFSTHLNNVGEGRSLTLMYHRIIPRSKVGAFLQPGMYVEPETFELHLQFLKKYFSMQHVSALYPSVNSTVKGFHGRPECAITFDDGWVDFYEYAFPLLVKHTVSATVFLPTGFIDTGKIFWSERLGNICAAVATAGNFDAFKEFAQRQLLLQDSFQTLPVTDFYEVVLEALKKYREEAIEDILEQIENHFALVNRTDQSNFLTWVQIEEMRSSGLVSFGSHTNTHRILTTLGQDEIYREVTLSMQALRERKAVDGDGVAFCYPNGNLNEKVIEQLKSSGYACAFTTRCGWNDTRTPLFALNRVGVHQDISNTAALLAYRIYSASS